MALFFRILQHLLPDARAWRITLALQKRLEQFFAAIAEVLADVREYADLAARDLYVDETRLLAKHQEQFGLAPIGTEEEQLAAVRAAWRATGGQSPAYLQSVLQAAGFDIYVHEWWGSGSLIRLLGPSLMRGWWVFDPEHVTEQVLDEVQSVENLLGDGHALAAVNAGARLTYSADAGPGGVRHVGSALATGADALETDFEFEFQDRPGMWAVLRLWEVPGGDQALVAIDGPSGGERFWQLRAEDGNFLFRVRYELGFGAIADVVGPALDTAWHLFEFYMLETGWLLVVDGVEFTNLETTGVSNDADGGSSAFRAPVLGAPLELRELVLFEGVPNDEQIVAGRNYFAHRYAPLGLSVVPRDPREYTEYPLIGTVQCDEDIAQCGEPEAQCNNLLGNEVGYLVNQAGTPNAPPGIPSDPKYWPYFLYFGAERFPDLAEVPVRRRAELERLLLKLTPSQHWLVLLINYVFGEGEPEPLETEGGEAFETEDGETIYIE